MRIYDVTSWSYVNLDDPLCLFFGLQLAALCLASSFPLLENPFEQYAHGTTRGLHTYTLAITMQVCCSYPAYCSSLALSSAQNSSKRNSLVIQVGPIFSPGDQNFQEKIVRPDRYSGNFGPQDQFFRRTKIFVTVQSSGTPRNECLVGERNMLACIRRLYLWTTT